MAGLGTDLAATAKSLPQYWPSGSPVTPCSVQNISQSLRNGISMPRKTLRTPETYLRQEKVDCVQPKPCSST